MEKSSTRAQLEFWTACGACGRPLFLLSPVGPGARYGWHMAQWWAAVRCRGVDGVTRCEPCRARVVVPSGPALRVVGGAA